MSRPRRRAGSKRRVRKTRTRTTPNGSSSGRWLSPVDTPSTPGRPVPSRRAFAPTYAPSLSLSPAGGARFGTPGARSTSAASPPPAISSSTPSASLLARGRAASGRLGGGGSDRLRGASLTDRRHFLGLITSRKGPAIDILIFSGISCAHECTGIFIQWSDFTRGAISTRRGCSSNGRASALHAEGRGIDTLQLHIFFFFLHPKQKSLRAAKQEQSIHSLFPLREAKVNYEGLVGRYARLRSPTVT